MKTSIQTIFINSKPSQNMITSETLLLDRINKLSKYYNKKTIDMLTSLVMLEESVFRQVAFGEVFGKLNLFLEIAKYNICNRTIKTLEELPDIDNEKFTASIFEHWFRIYYEGKPKTNFHVFTSSFSSDKKFCIDLFSINGQVENRIKNINTRISELEGKKYGSDARLAGYTPDGRPYFEEVVGGPNAREYYEDKNTKENLVGKLESLKSYGEIQQTICNQVTEALLRDWNIKFDENMFSRDKVKELPWINVYVKNK